MVLVLALAILFVAARRLGPPSASQVRRTPPRAAPSANSADSAAAEALARYRPVEYTALVDPAATAAAPLTASDTAVTPLLHFLDPTASIAEQALVGPESRTALRWARSLVILLIVLVLLQRLLFG